MSGRAEQAPKLFKVASDVAALVGCAGVVVRAKVASLRRKTAPAQRRVGQGKEGADHINVKFILQLDVRFVFNVTQRRLDQSAYLIGYACRQRVGLIV